MGLLFAGSIGKLCNSLNELRFSQNNKTIQKSSLPLHLSLNFPLIFLNFLSSFYFFSKSTHCCSFNSSLPTLFSHSPILPFSPTIPINNQFVYFMLLAYIIYCTTNTMIYNFVCLNLPFTSSIFSFFSFACLSFPFQSHPVTLSLPLLFQSPHLMVIFRVICCEWNHLHFLVCSLPSYFLVTQKLISFVRFQLFACLLCFVLVFFFHVSFSFSFYLLYMRSPSLPFSF